MQPSNLFSRFSIFDVRILCDISPQSIPMLHRETPDELPAESRFADAAMSAISIPTALLRARRRRRPSNLMMSKDPRAARVTRRVPYDCPYLERET